MVFETAVNRNTEVFLKDLQTGQETNISNCSARDYQPSITHDAKKVLFWSDRTGHPEFYDVNLADVFYVKGLRAENEGSDDSAISYFTWAVDVDVLHIPSHHALGRLYYDSNNCDKAIEEFSIVAGYSTGELAKILREHTQGSISSEMSELATAVKNVVYAYDNLGLAFVGKGNKKAAAGTHYALGTLFETIEWDKFAIVEFQKGLSLDNQPSSDIYNHLSKLYKDISDYQSSGQILRKSLEIDPNSASAHSNLGILYLKQGLENEAKSEFEKALNIEPNFVEVRQNLAVYYFEKGDYLKALENWQTLLKIAPNYPNVKKNIELAWTKQAEVKPETKQSKPVEPRDAQAYSDRGLAKMRAGKGEEGLADFTQAINISPNDPAGYWNRAMAYLSYSDQDVDNRLAHLKSAISDLAMFVRIKDYKLNAEDESVINKVFFNNGYPQKLEAALRAQAARLAAIGEREEEIRYYLISIEIKAAFQDDRISTVEKIQRFNAALHALKSANPTAVQAARNHPN